jgi:hypothetical protein
LDVAKDVEALLASMRANPQNVRFADACKVADHYFGKPRHAGTSHRVWKMPWAGDPRVNMQEEGGKAKRYQVEQLVAAIDRRNVELEKHAQEAEVHKSEKKSIGKKGKRS